jgi:hypothetical protein
LAPSINHTVYSLFCGIGLAITAVPIPGRILREFGLTRTDVGVVAISAAAVNDVVGWILLSWRRHLPHAALGTLMDTRALMELIVLNIGCDLGFIPLQGVYHAGHHGGGHHGHDRAAAESVAAPDRARDTGGRRSPTRGT